MIWLLFSSKHRQEFKRWFQSPARWWERLLAAVASALVLAVLGLVARLFAGPLPLLPVEVLLQTVLAWAGLAALSGVLLGTLFPKVMLCAVYPFSLVTIGSDDVS